MLQSIEEDLKGRGHDPDVGEEPLPHIRAGPFVDIVGAQQQPCLYLRDEGLYRIELLLGQLYSRGQEPDKLVWSAGCA